MVCVCECEGGFAFYPKIVINFGNLNQNLSSVREVMTLLKTSLDLTQFYDGCFVHFLEQANMKQGL